MKRQISRNRIILISVLLLCGAAFFTATSPQRVPVVLLVVPFAYIFAVSYLLCALVLNIVFSFLNEKLVASIMALLITLLFILGSLHQLGTRDIILSLVFVTLIIWYLPKTNQHKPKR